MNDEARTSEDPRDAAILRAAFECFARYGLRRTSMEEIADEDTGASRWRETHTSQGSTTP